MVRGRGRQLRVAYGRICQETNAFSPVLSTCEDFRRLHFVEGAELQRVTGRWGSEVPRMIRNAELNLFVPDRGFADTTFERVFRLDIPASDRIGVQKLSWWERVKGFVMNLLRRFL